MHVSGAMTDSAPTWGGALEGNTGLIEKRKEAAPLGGGRTRN